MGRVQGDFDSSCDKAEDMDAGEFLTGPEAARAIARAAKVARTAVSIHAHDAGRESDKVAGCGACAEACAFVHTLPWGPQACRRSRETPAKKALARGRPVPYLCHMGFACVAGPVLPGTHDPHVATFGPYCPAETPDALELDARAGLSRLERAKRDELPFSLADIPRVPAEVVPEVAEWFDETLLKQFSDGADGKRIEAAVNIESETLLKHSSSNTSGARDSARTRSRSAKVVRDGFGARAILAAMANPDAGAFREAIQNQIAVGRRLTPERLEARTAAVVAAVQEAATSGKGRQRGIGSATSRAVDMATLGRIKSVAEAVDATARALGPLRREALRAGDGSASFYSEVERYVEERLAESLSLDAAAKHFQVPPSTLTRRLERRYGLTFTGYVARRRVERAKTLLGKSKLSVDSVARRVGLTDGAHLRKWMRRFEGSSPTRLRKAR